MDPFSAEAPVPPRRLGRTAVLTLKTFHSIWFLSVAAALIHVLDAGLRGNRGRLTAPAFALAMTQSGIFALNQGHCPLTEAMARRSPESGRVSDLFLPLWLADRLPSLVATPLVLGAVGLGTRRSTTPWRSS